MNNVRGKIAGLYASMGPAYAITRVAELAPGIVAVEDASGECDALFDQERWEYTYPKIWEPPMGSAALKAENIGLLPGLGRAPHVTTIEEMVEFAQQQLMPKDTGTVWCTVPDFFEV